ncbi:MAG TPA: polysaccharide biosynthesis tyrosine autokinase [Gemmatimonadaceae bacterium]|nr:polysaccharide biosynthesis tyrosine autokinase [Gemmatimonadaceae bacterium]
MTPHPSNSNGALTPRPIIIPAPAGAHAALDTDNLMSPPGPDWQRLGHALRRYRWFILFVTAACVGLGYLATRIWRPEYTADTMLWIDGGTAEIAREGPVRPRQDFNAEAWTSLLYSYSVLEDVVRDAHLYLAMDAPDKAALMRGFALDDDFQTGEYHLSVNGRGDEWTLATAGAVPETGAVGDSVGRSFGFLWKPPAASLTAGRDLDFTVTSPRHAAVALREDLEVNIDEAANFLSVELTGTDPDRLAVTLNALGDRFVEQAAALKQQNVGELSDILGEQVATARAALTSAENALADYRTRTATVPEDLASLRGAPAAAGPSLEGGAGMPRSEAYYDLVGARDRAQREVQEIEAALASAGRGGLGTATLERVAERENASQLTAALTELTEKRSELRTLRYRYPDAYPPIQRLIGEISTLETSTIPPLAMAVAARIRERGSDLGRRVASTESTLRAIPARDREVGRLERQALLAEELYSTLQQRYDNARLAEESAVAEVRVLDAAVPPAWPSRNSEPVILLISLVGGLAIAGTLAVVLDKSDKRFRYPDQVTRDLGLTILGAVPHVKPSGNAMVRSKASTPFQESLRDIRLNLSYAHGSTGPLLMTITSPGSADGKSFLATHLSRVFAEGGARTLLIDADLRRGMLNERFNHQRRPGLTEYLRGTEPVERIVQHTVVERLDLVTCGSRQREAPELLGGGRLKRLLNEVRDDYDVIICDSPPLSAGIDAVVLGAATENMLLVVRTGVSQREVAASRLEVLGRTPVRVLGAVLNDVPRDNAYSYYTHYALPGYETQTEESTENVLVGR